MYAYVAAGARMHMHMHACMCMCMHAPPSAHLQLSHPFGLEDVAAPAIETKERRVELHRRVVGLVVHRHHLHTRTRALGGACACVYACVYACACVCVEDAPARQPP